VSAIAETLGVSRSNLVERLQSEPKPRSRYRKEEDVILLPLLRDLVDRRITYGYRRTTAMLNRRFEAEGKPRVNPKRIYRIMKQNGLLLARYTGKPGRPHEGKVITLKSNLRWCSDDFEIRCWNGDRVHVTFALDCCDREVPAFVGSSAAITGEDVRDLMVQAVEERFGPETRTLPHPIQWLSDNGGAYTADETRALGRQIGFVMCNTPAYSPESNGMAESFVKTFKRDYVYVNRLESAESVLAQLPAWFEDYNEFHPHKGLKMKSPREYRRQTLTTACPV
jgi:transposase InsO family protein